MTKLINEEILKAKGERREFLIREQGLSQALAEATLKMELMENKLKALANAYNKLFCIAIAEKTEHRELINNLWARADDEETKAIVEHYADEDRHELLINTFKYLGELK